MFKCLFSLVHLDGRRIKHVRWAGQRDFDKNEFKQKILKLDKTMVRLLENLPNAEPTKNFFLKVSLF